MEQKETFEQLINGSQPVLVDFYATWCGPCQMMGPVLNELSKKVVDKARIIKIDVDKSQEAAQKYDIQGVPTFILFKKGKPVWRHSGMITGSQLEQVITLNEK